MLDKQPSRNSNSTLREHRLTGVFVHSSLMLRLTNRLMFVWSGRIQQPSSISLYKMQAVQPSPSTTHLQGRRNLLQHLPVQAAPTQLLYSSRKAVRPTTFRLTQWPAYQSLHLPSQTSSSTAVVAMTQGASSRSILKLSPANWLKLKSSGMIRLLMYAFSCAMLTARRSNGTLKAVDQVY